MRPALMVPQQFLVLLGRQQPLSLGQYWTTTMSMRLPVNKGSCKVKGIPKSLKTSHINHCDSIRYYHCAQIPVQETVLSLEKKKLSIQGFLACIRNGTRV